MFFFMDFSWLYSGIPRYSYLVKEGYQFIEARCNDYGLSSSNTTVNKATQSSLARKGRFYCLFARVLREICLRPPQVDSSVRPLIAWSLFFAGLCLRLFCYIECVFYDFESGVAQRQHPALKEKHIHINNCQVQLSTNRKLSVLVGCRSR